MTWYYSLSSLYSYSSISISSLPLLSFLVFIHSLSSSLSHKHSQSSCVAVAVAAVAGAAFAMLLLAGLVAFAFASLSNVEYATRVVVRTAACVAEETKAGKSTGASCLCVATDTRTHARTHALTHSRMHTCRIVFGILCCRRACRLCADGRRRARRRASVDAVSRSGRYECVTG